MNKVILVGRLARDPELRATASGVPVCGFSVACDRRFVKEGEERQADFISCIAWRQTGESIAKFFKKGHRIALEGTLQTKTWQDSDGKTRYAMEVVVESWEFAQSKSEIGQAPSTSAPYTENTENTQETEQGDINDFMPIEDEDLPF